MKRYFIGLITGILLMVSAMIFIGAVNNGNKAGTYQLVWGEDSFRLIDTRTGQMYYRDSGGKFKGKWLQRANVSFERFDPIKRNKKKK